MKEPGHMKNENKQKSKDIQKMKTNERARTYEMRTNKRARTYEK